MQELIILELLKNILGEILRAKFLAGQLSFDQIQEMIFAFDMANPTSEKINLALHNMSQRDPAVYEEVNLKLKETGLILSQWNPLKNE